jgi:hypothetical protein
MLSGCYQDATADATRMLLQMRTKILPFFEKAWHSYTTTINGQPESEQGEKTAWKNNNLLFIPSKRKLLRVLKGMSRKTT